MGVGAPVYVGLRTNPQLIASRQLQPSTAGTAPPRQHNQPNPSETNVGNTSQKPYIYKNIVAHSTEAHGTKPFATSLL